VHYAASNGRVGALKSDSVSDFFDSILDGTANLSSPHSQVPEGTYELTPEEEEIERKQEAQRLALLHGGFADMVDFEEAVKKYGPDFHGAHGYGASLGDAVKGQKVDPEKGAQERHEREEDPMHRAIRIQREKEEQMAKEVPNDAVPKTDGAEQVVLDARMAADMNDSAMGAKATQASSPTEAPNPDSDSEGVASHTTSLPPVAGEGTSPERTPPAAQEHLKDEL